LGGKKGVMPGRGQGKPSSLMTRLRKRGKHPPKSWKKKKISHFSRGEEAPVGALQREEIKAGLKEKKKKDL